MSSAAVKVSVIVASCSTINCAFIPVAMDREATMDEALGIRAGPLPRGIHALVEDEIAAGGGFVLAHLLARALGRRDEDPHDGGVEEGGGGHRRASPRVCLVCAEQDFAHHARVMGKLGRNLRADVSSGALAVVDALTTPFAWCANPDLASGPSRAKMTGGVEAHTRRADASGLDGARDLFRDIARALGGDHDDDDDDDEDDDTAGAVVVVFDSLNALADGEPTAADADRAVPSLLASVSSLRRGSTAIVALAHRDACPTDGRGWLDAARRRADVVVSCRALTTGHAADVHGRVSAEHRTGRMATTATNGSAAPRRVDARFRLTELGPKVTRVHA